MPMKDPFNPVDDNARAMAADILTPARHGALGVRDTETGHPSVSRVALLWHDSSALILISDLSAHAQALRNDARCSIMIGEPGQKGDPLTYPRLMLTTLAEFVEKDTYREAWLSAHQKTKLYFDFADFNICKLTVKSTLLNGGFGKAYKMSLDDLP